MEIGSTLGVISAASAVIPTTASRRHLASVEGWTMPTNCRAINTIGNSKPTPKAAMVNRTSVVYLVTLVRLLMPSPPTLKRNSNAFGRVRYATAAPARNSVVETTTNVAAYTFSFRYSPGAMNRHNW